MTIKHTFVSGIADGGDTTLVRPSNWNADHTVLALVSPLTTVSFSATPTFDASLGNNFKITLTANVTSSTLSNATTGQHLTFEIIQDSSGSHTFVWPTNVKGGLSFSGAALAINATIIQTFFYDGTNAYAETPGVIN